MRVCELESGFYEHLIQNTTRRTVWLRPTRYYWYCEDTDRRKTFAAAGFLDSHAHTNDPESFTDPML